MAALDTRLPVEPSATLRMAAEAAAGTPSREPRALVVAKLTFVYFQPRRDVRGETRFGTFVVSTVAGM
jgi:hypothetical protein